MARRGIELGDKALAAAIRKALAELGTGKKKLITVGGEPGLHLQVRVDGQAWLYRYQAGLTAAGKPWRRDMGLGSYPDVGLAEAREMVRGIRREQREGIDPIDQRRAQAPRVRPEAAMTFDEAAKHLIKVKAPEWTNAKHAAQWRSTLDNYASPAIGHMPVDKIELRHVVDVLTPLWSTKTATATRLRSRIEAVLSWATASGHRSGDNPARWAGNLDAGILAKPGKIRKVKHHAALPIDGMHGFVVELRKREGIAAKALEFVILTAARSGEVRGAVWAEIDMDAKTWTVPGERMKANKPHTVPLSSTAMALLKALPRFAGTDLVFPSPTGKMLSDMTLSAVMRRMEVDAVPHGFRSTFRDWASERTNYPRDVAEMALAHTIGDKVEAAYRRGDLLAKRTKMMADWAKFIETAPASGNVVAIGAKKCKAA